MSAPARPRPPARSAPEDARSTPRRAVELARVALVPVLASYAAVVVLAGVVAALASGATPGGEPGLGQALAVGVPLWLAAHLVPLRLQGVPVGVLPLLPALGVALLVAVTAARAVRRLGGRGAAVPVVATAAAAHAACGVLAAALLTPDAVIDASPALAGVVSGLLAALAALAGVARPCGVTASLRRTPAWLRRGIRSGLAAVAVLVAAGATLVTAVLLADADAVAAVYDRVAPQPGSGAGLTLLSVGYLPNAVVAATSWILGPGVAVGAASASPTAVVTGPLPPLPLAALLPDAVPPSWVGLTFAVPLAVGSLVGWMVAPRLRDVTDRLRALAVAATTAAVVLALLAALSGGRLGAGPFDPVDVPAGWVLLATLAWLVVPGAVVALLAVPSTRARPTRPARTRSGRPSRSAAPAAGRGHDGPVDVDDDTDDDVDDPVDEADDDADVDDPVDGADELDDADGADEAGDAGRAGAGDPPRP